MRAGSVRVYREDNGYVIRHPDGRIVIEDTEGAAEAAVSMLWQVNELIGHIGSRYDAARVVISLEPGDKWTGGTE